MEGGAFDGLLRAGNDVLGSIKLRLCSISWYTMMVRSSEEDLPDESRIEGVQEQRPAKCNLSRLWYPEPRIGVKAPLRAPLWYAPLKGDGGNHKAGHLP